MPNLMIKQPETKASMNNMPLSAKKLHGSTENSKKGSPTAFISLDLLHVSSKYPYGSEAMKSGLKKYAVNGIKSKIKKKR